MDSLDFSVTQHAELAELERHLAQVRLAHELREQRRTLPRSSGRTAGSLRQWFAAALHRDARPARRPVRRLA